MRPGPKWSQASPISNMIIYSGFLPPAIANDITTALSSGSIPVHGPFHHKGAITRLHGHRDFIAVIAVPIVVEVLDDRCHHVHGVATMPKHRDREGVDGAHRIGDGRGDRFGVGGGILDGEPLIVAEVGVALGKAIITHGGWTDLAKHIGTTGGGERASIAHMMVSEVHLPLHHDPGPRRFDLGRDRLRGRPGAVGIHIPDDLAERVHGHGKRMGGAIGILQANGDAGGLARVQIGEHEVLLELHAGVALGKEPVAGQGLHADHISPTRDRASVARIDSAEVGGALGDHWLSGGENHRHMRWQPGVGLRGEDRATAIGRDRHLLGADLLPIGIVGSRDGGRDGARVQDGQERSVAAATHLRSSGQISKVEGGARMCDADHVAAAVRA